MAVADMPGQRKVYVISGGVTKFAKAHSEMDFRLMVKKAYDYAMGDVPKLKPVDIESSRISYFSDHFARQLKAASMVQDFLGLNPKDSRRIEWGGATGGQAIQSAWETIASGRDDVCLVAGFETMSSVETWKGNEFIALASDTNFDYPVGGFYTGYYALMVQRHIFEFLRRRKFAGIKDERKAQQAAAKEAIRVMAMVSVKNHVNALYNPYAQYPEKLTLEESIKREMISYPLNRPSVCAMSDGAAVMILASEDSAFKYTDHPVLIKGVGCGTDTMRLADRPQGKVPLFAWEDEEYYSDLKYPGVHSFRAGRTAAIEAYKNAGIRNPSEEISFVELHDAYASSEIQTYEDIGLCRYGEGYDLVTNGHTFMKDIEYGLDLPSRGKIPVNPSGGLIACGHPVGATGIMQGVFAFWQLQNSIGKHFGTDKLQVKGAKRGLIHSHAGTGSAVTVSILERV
jgi:acetyl-CoA C-acetyltransferase